MYTTEVDKIKLNDQIQLGHNDTWQTHTHVLKCVDSFCDQRVVQVCPSNEQRRETYRDTSCSAHVQPTFEKDAYNGCNIDRFSPIVEAAALTPAGPQCSGLCW